MTYTISEVAQMMGVTAHTLRYYDQEGLLPFVDRVNGRRVFKDADFAWLRVIHCLKNTGMPLKDIREYIELGAGGDATLEARQAIIKKQHEAVEAQIRALQVNLKELEYKEWYYETAIAAGTESIHFGRPCNPGFEPDEIDENLCVPPKNGIE